MFFIVAMPFELWSQLSPSHVFDSSASEKPLCVMRCFVSSISSAWSSQIFLRFSSLYLCLILSLSLCRYWKRVWRTVATDFMSKWPTEISSMAFWSKSSLPKPTLQLLYRTKCCRSYRFVAAFSVVFLFCLLCLVFSERLVCGKPRWALSVCTTWQVLHHRLQPLVLLSSYMRSAQASEHGVLHFSSCCPLNIYRDLLKNTPRDTSLWGTFLSDMSERMQEILFFIFFMSRIWLFGKKAIVFYKVIFIALYFVWFCVCRPGLMPSGVAPILPESSIFMRNWRGKALNSQWQTWTHCHQFTHHRGWVQVHTLYKFIHTAIF